MRLRPFVLLIALAAAVSPWLTACASQNAAPVTTAAVGFQPGECTRTIAPGADLQQAIDQLPADVSPATLCLSKGTYPIVNLVHIERNGVHLRGVGADTVVQMKDGVQQPLFVIGDYVNQQPAHPVENVSIENMRIVGTTHLEHEFMPERPYLSNSAVVVRAGKHILLSGLTVTQCRSACLLSEFDTTDLTIRKSDVSGATWDGLSFNRSSHIQVLDNNIHDNVAAGITTEHMEDSVVRGNRLERNGSQGVYLSDSNRNRFESNSIIGNKTAGVILACSIRFRKPELLCWDNSMSQDNLFEHNHFQGNPYIYTIGADRAANCKSPDFKQNLWRGNVADAGGYNPPAEYYGNCVRMEP
jgi:parallel beta-helix repeat protein